MNLRVIQNLYDGEFNMKFSGMMKKDSHVLFSINIGQKDQTGEFFTKMANLIIGNPNIKKITLFKADTLQRHRIKVVSQLTNEDAEKKARYVSEKWEKENTETIAKLTSNKSVTIKTWDNYLLHENYKQAREEIDNFYNTNQEFRDKVDNLAAAFSKKIIEELNVEVKEYNYELLVNTQKDYCLEECAVSILLGKDNAHYDYELYKGERNQPLKMIHKQFVAPGRMASISIVQTKEEKNGITHDGSKRSEPACSDNNNNNNSFQFFNGSGIQQVYIQSGSTGKSIVNLKLCIGDLNTTLLFLGSLNTFISNWEETHGKGTLKEKSQSTAIEHKFS